MRIEGKTKPQRAAQTAILAGLVLLCSGGALVWQISAYQRRTAEMLAMQSSLPQDQPGEWREAKAAEKKAPIAAIQNQLNAFKRNDYLSAMTYQSYALRSHFPAPAAFRHMMENSYPQFTRWKKAEFTEAYVDKEGTRFRVVVFVTGKDGVKVRALYQMVKENGAWHVGGVQGGMASGMPNRTKPAPRQTPNEARKITA